MGRFKQYYMSHGQTWSLSHDANKANGTCSVCHAVRQLHLKDGTIHRPGPRHNPCHGSDKATILSTLSLSTASYQPAAFSTTIGAARPLVQVGRRPINTTSRTQRHHIPSADQSKHAIRSETAGTVLHRGKRPDGRTLIPWQRRKSVTWDAIVADTVADSYLHLTSAKADGVSENATTKKENKYVDLQQTHSFVPLASKRLDPFTSKAWNFLKSWGLHSCSSASPSRCSVSTQSRSLTYLRKRLS